MRKENEDPEFKSKKNAACVFFKSNLQLDTPEKQLWFAVFERMVKDIGKWYIKLNYRKERYFGTPPYNSDHAFTNRNGFLCGLCFILDMDPGYVISTLTRRGILPIKKDFYDKIKADNGV